MYGKLSKLSVDTSISKNNDLVALLKNLSQILFKLLLKDLKVPMYIGTWYVNITEQVCVDLFDVIALILNSLLLKFSEKKHQREVYIYIIQF